ncbi:glycosyltransferase family 4 protein [Sphingomonas ginsenosidivorax]|uniref:Glycosyltransferase family 4 protein n=1 Tax=Sphingomonas ginsenosidivorax TaxID=862135 RepID=A0A5C6UH45_9SPHN|nr:glycosyltransferase family 1 protein [Sphingomonas ginsenosidivorax]TXC72019.1 glycosyltransferase family 4 protein [Sphingomonas ginsenosidivorax]
MNAPGRTFTLAVDASWLREGGIARMGREILARRPAHVRVVEMRVDRPNAGILTPIGFARAIRATQADAVWSPGFFPPVVRSAKTPISITVHDLTHLHYYSLRHRLYYDLVVRPLLRNVDRIFTVSDYTRDELLAWTDFPADRVVRIYNGVSNAFYPVSNGETALKRTERYILYVGNRRSYKNIDGLITAFAHSLLPARGYRLWLTGVDDGVSSVRAAQLGIGDRLRYLGHLSDTDLADAYRGARMTAFLSLYEGFGLPVVEAMACGCPVITSDTTSLAEIAGDAALTVDPTSLDAIVCGLNRLATDDILRGALQQAGLRRAATFDWDACAAQYWALLASGY